MPKRAAIDFDPTKSDSDDSDFDLNAAGPSRSSRATKKSHNGRPARKKRRTSGYNSSDIIGDEDGDSDRSGESYSDDEDDEPEEPEIDPRTGRPVRSSAKKKVVYEESDSDSEAFINKLNSDSEGDAKPHKGTSKKKKKGGRKSLVIKLNMGPRRDTRARSGSGQNQRPTSAREAIPGQRRSSRIAHDENEELYALTNSGHHAEVARKGTESPPPYEERPTKGGKGLKKPPSAIMEASHESSVRTKTEPDETETAIQSDDEVGGSNHVQDAQVLRESPAIVPESEHGGGGDDDDDDEDEEEDVLSKRRSRRLTSSGQGPEKPRSDNENVQDARSSRRAALRSLAAAQQPSQSHSQRGKKRHLEESSDFEPAAEGEVEEEVSSSEESGSPHKDQDGDSDSSQSGGGKKRATRGSSRRAVTQEHESEADELAEELQALQADKRPRRRARMAADMSADDRPQTRKRKPVDYRILRPELALAVDDEAPLSAITPSRRGAGRGATGAWRRDLFSTHGPFGGGGGLPPVLGGGPGGIGATGGVDSDSSDDDAVRPRTAGVGGMVGMTPTAGAPPGFGGFPAPQTHSSDALQASLGKIKDKKELADADPLGVDQHVNFDGVGGLQGHIDQLKEMVALPLLYPEVFQRFKITPPRGVLFHGPPGTGKTLMARALATSVSSEGRKVTFYMRKGADALSKWVGEAERQLRQLFDEARKNQPSIIFFDEIDGLAPVRSSKQEQIHASIVSTLLALMDGMDGRGQVIVIGATNRPDSVDPALRRPGRFDREFYFPLPNKEARLKILEIHTQGWNPPLDESLKKELADVTKGYGGADLRGLCTEAAINAVQRCYPQIYRSDKKLQIKPENINVAAKDFMLSVKKIVPSSERAVGSGAAPLPKSIEPLLTLQLEEIEKTIAEMLPHKKPSTALEEAQFESLEGDEGMRVERLQQEFERSRVFRPRLLIRGSEGMGQQYLAAALLSRFEGLHVQSFDLPTLLSDSTRSPEAATVQLFAELKRHKPSVIYLPNVDTWYRTVGEAVISTFKGLLRSLAPTDPVLLLGVLENEIDQVDPLMLREFFGYSKRNQFIIERPTRAARRDFFIPLRDYLNLAPSEFPDPTERKKRVLEDLPVAEAPPPKQPPPPSEAEIRAQRKKDKVTLNQLKSRLNPIMEQIRTKYRIFRVGVIEDSAIRYLFDEQNPNVVTSDMPIDELQRTTATFRPYEKDTDKNGHPGLREVASDKFYYNMDSVTIQNRLQNGYYKRPKDFLADIKKLTKDARAVGDEQRISKASELQSNVEVDILTWFDAELPAFVAECEAVYLREQKREKEMFEKATKEAETAGREPPKMVSAIPPNESAQDSLQGPVLPGKASVNGVAAPAPFTPQRDNDNSTLTNGISDLSNLQGPNQNSNDTSGGSKDNDVPMSNSDELSSGLNGTQSSFGPSAQTRPHHMLTGPPDLQHRLSYPGSLSQKSAITPMAEGSAPHMYENLASSTSSDKRNTGSTGETQTQDNPQSNGVSSKEDDGEKNGTSMHISMIVEDPPPNSQLPSTQGQGPSQSSHNDSLNNSGQSQRQQPSQTPAVPRFPGNILMDSPLSQRELKLDRKASSDFIEELARATGGCSIEQLEQVYSALMNEIWRTRGEWNRTKAIEDVKFVLLDLLDDMENCQAMGALSHEELGRQEILRAGMDA